MLKTITIKVVEIGYNKMNILNEIYIFILKCC